MRLRPSGRSGPVATQIDGFRAIRSARPGPGSTWRSPARASFPGRRNLPRRSRQAIRDVLCRKRDARAIAADVVEMRAAIAKEKGDADPWDLKYAAGALVDIEFIAQYLQLIHAAATPEILDTSTARSAGKGGAARRAQAGGCRGVAAGGAAVSRPDANLAALPAGGFRSEDGRRRRARSVGARRRSAGFSALQAHVEETQRQVRECFVRILGKAP